MKNKMRVRTQNLKRILSRWINFDDILDTPAPITVVPTKATYEPAPGVGTRDTWKAEIVDLKDLVHAIATGKAPAECVTPNMPYLNSAVRMTKENTNIPGVKAVKETTTVMR